MSNFLKRLPALIAAAVLLTSCGATSVETDMEIHDAKSISVTMNVGYPRDADKESVRESLDSALKTDGTKVKVNDFFSDQYHGKSYEWEDVSLAEFEGFFSDFDIDSGTIKEVEGRYVVSLPYTGIFDSMENAQFTVEMPGKVTNAPGAVVDGNKATWNLADYDKSEMVLESEMSSGVNPGAVIALLTGLLAIGAGFFYYRKVKTEAGNPAINEI